VTRHHFLYILLPAEKRAPASNGELLDRLLFVPSPLLKRQEDLNPRRGAMCRLGIAVVLLMMLFASVACADLVPIGLLSFELVIPGTSGSPGVNGFTVANLTGDPAFNGFALPPDFPVLSDVTFLSSTLTLTTGSIPHVYNLGEIGPGFFSSSPIQFADTTLFSSAIFSAALSPTHFDLSGTPGGVPS
jgi:hypothetical protein